MSDLLTAEPSEAENLLYQSIGALNDPELGMINLFPFTVESEETNKLKRQVCRAIVALFKGAGYSMDLNVIPPAEPIPTVTLNCRSCGNTVLSVAVGKNGVAHVPAATIISSMARLSPDCPHGVVTPEDQRRKIQEAVKTQGNHEISRFSTGLF